MKKPLVLIAAIVGIVGLGAAVAVGKDTTRVRTSVSIEFNANDPSDPHAGGYFSGRVKATNGCQKGRTVVVYEVGGSPKAFDESNNRGKYKTGSIKPKDLLYIAKLRKKTITKNNGDKIVCKEGRSKRLTIGGWDDGSSARLAKQRLRGRYVDQPRWFLDLGPPVHRPTAPRKNAARSPVRR